VVIVVTDSRVLLDRKMMEARPNAPINIAVEMIAEDLTKTKYLSPLSTEAGSDAIEAAWPEIRKGVLELLEGNDATAGHLTFLVASGMGFDPGITNPARCTSHWTTNLRRPAGLWFTTRYADLFTALA
jgi:hypothetical protein